MSALLFQSKSLFRTLTLNVIGSLFFLIVLWLIIKENNVIVTTPIIICYLISFLFHSLAKGSGGIAMNRIQQDEANARLAHLQQLTDEMTTYVRQSNLLVEHSEEMVNEWRKMEGLGDINRDIRY